MLLVNAEMTQCERKSYITGIVASLVGLITTAMLRNTSLGQKVAFAMSSLILGCAVAWENIDSFCVERTGTHPTLWHRNKPNSDDDIQTLLAKMEVQATHRNSEVIWRKSYIVSVLVALGTWGLAAYKIPTAREWLLTLLISWCIMYKMHTSYTYHAESRPMNYMLEIIELLGKRLGYPRDLRALKLDERLDDNSDLNLLAKQLAD